MNNIIFPALSLGGLGLLFGLGLGFAAKKFAVQVNPLVPKVRDALPGANCGGCGFAGCDAFAKAVVDGHAPLNGCPVGGGECATAIAAIMGMEVKQTAKTVAYVKCNGTCDKAKEKYVYEGVMDCVSANMLQGKGSKACEYGCLGLGSCIKACQFGAIDIVDGVAVILPEKCVACGMCVSACPKNLIEIVPDAMKVRVACSSFDKGKSVKDNCAVGCISCGLCQKNCPYDAIHVNNGLAKVDYDKCVQCGICVDKCPTDAIVRYQI
ncbi:RnfABCDGE type electron transport complex subunit B [Clostridiales bacterium F-3ap]|uniref:Ion-translocating oxidoreductase complex subunit B n=1 Tax=Anaerotalea alkaliphila TaxID=2662126 RepID=A0A7X5KNM8_9FIRM|nr:RnfABCDGE type electron transport complex subunit B [Anaerotalea alkaliphila]